jgi:YD repeat-containing protein
VGNQVQKAYRFGSSGVSYILESNPYASSDTPGGWILTTRDAPNRTTKVQYYSGSSPPSPWSTNPSITGTVTSAYDQTATGCAGAAVKVTDESGNTHVNCYDGLGRLTSVIEPNPSNGNLDPSSASNPATATCYTYDALDNLTSVAPGAHTTTPCVGATPTRQFNYDTLSRLTSATNPESGTVNYNLYDNNGNLKTVTDARGTVTNMTYDALNRLTHKLPYCGAIANRLLWILHWLWTSSLSAASIVS